MRLAAAALLALVLSAQPCAAQDQPPLPEFMVGAWEERADDKLTEESWTSGPVRMLGSARQTSAGVVSMRENLVIERVGRELALIVQGQEGPPVVFPMTAHGVEAIEFANPAHDYPQRIRYWRDGERLMAEIALLDGSEAVSWSYRPKR